MLTNKPLKPDRIIIDKTGIQNHPFSRWSAVKTVENSHDFELNSSQNFAIRVYDFPILCFVFMKIQADSAARFLIVLKFDNLQTRSFFQIQLLVFRIVRFELFLS